MAKKKFASTQTYPDPIWKKDLMSPLLLFNVAMTYRISTGQAIPNDKPKYFWCTHCKKSRDFWIERINKNCFKCARCSSLVETT